MTNKAVVFIKPHAMTEKTVAFAEAFLARRGIGILKRGVLTAERIDSEGIVDRHYSAIAHTAVELTPREYVMSAEAKKKFLDAFGEDWDAALAGGKIRNSKELMSELKLKTGDELQVAWSSGKQAKLGPGFYACRLNDRDRYVINGFYPAMREKFTAAGGRIGWYVVEFDPSVLPWKSFRAEVIGATDPAKAADGSLRKELMKKYRELGQTIEPSMSNNGVHASAGPVEGLKEQQVWAGTDVAKEELAASLLGNGMTVDRLRELLSNGTATVGGKSGPVFDLTEDMDANDVIGILR